MREHEKEILPIIMQINKPSVLDQEIHDNFEKYNYDEDVLEIGKYWLGSKKSNTRCNKFTLVGSDKTHADDTKEKKK